MSDNLHVPPSLQPPVLDLNTPVLLDPENTIPRSAEILFGCSPTERYALVHCAFDKSAHYYNTFVRRPLALSGLGFLLCPSHSNCM